MIVIVPISQRTHGTRRIEKSPPDAAEVSGWVEADASLNSTL